MIFNYVKGKNLLPIVSADMAVFTPEHPLESIIKLTANLTAGSNFVKELQGSPGKYTGIANPARYTADSLLRPKAVSKQFAHAILKAQ